MISEFIREVYYYKDHYFKFFNKLSKSAQEKCNWTIQLIATTRFVPAKYIRYIVNSDGIYEIRVENGSDIYRIFCFFDKGNIIILLNGYQKKEQKTKPNEILLANKLKHEFYHEK